jgi:cardiolipin synthase C
MIRHFLTLFLAGLVALGGGLPFARADQVMLLNDASDSATARLRLIDQAQHEIKISAYKLNNDHVGFTFLSALRAAARKRPPIRVVLLINTSANSMPDETLAILASEGIEIYEYHPFDWKSPLRSLRRLSQRMHDKLFIADHNTLVTGDRNLSNEYYGLTERPFVSRDVLVVGKSAADATSYFDSMIQSGEVEPYRPRYHTPTVLKGASDQLDRYERSLLKSALKAIPKWKTNFIEADSAKFFHDVPGLKTALPGVHDEMVEAINRAKSEIVFENAYVILPDTLKDALKAAAERGVRIRVITNSFRSNDVKMAGAHWSKSREFLASLGAEVWEHPGPPEVPFAVRAQSWIDRIVHGQETPPVGQRRGLRRFLSALSSIHAKTMVIDGYSSYVTSYNFDPRSKELNTEVAQRIESKAFAKQLLESINRDLVKFKYIPVAANGAVDSSAIKSRLASCIVRWLSHPIQGQL